MTIPRRILILGPSGAGKSTLARAVGERLGLAVVHLDRLNWNPGWVQTEAGRFRERVAEEAAREAWVMDGNYSATIDLRLPRAEAVIWLDLPRHVYFPSAVWRSLRNLGRSRYDVGDACPERFEIAFFRDWVWTYPTRSRARHARLLASLPAGVRGVILRSRSQVGRFVAGLPASLEAAGGGRSADARSAPLPPGPGG